MRPRNEQGGELVVTGQDQVVIPLKDFPHRVEVKFKHKEEPPPCDINHNYDELDWEVHRNYNSNTHQFVLKISWKVQDVRELFWVAYY